MTEDLTQYEGKEGYSLVDTAQWETLRSELEHYRAAFRDAARHKSELEAESIRNNVIIDQQAMRIKQLESALANLREDAQHVEHNGGVADCTAVVARRLLTPRTPVPSLRYP